MARPRLPCAAATRTPPDRSNQRGISVTTPKRPHVACRTSGQAGRSQRLKAARGDAWCRPGGTAVGGACPKRRTPRQYRRGLRGAAHVGDGDTQRIMPVYRSGELKPGSAGSATPPSPSPADGTERYASVGHGEALLQREQPPRALSAGEEADRASDLSSATTSTVTMPRHQAATTTTVIRGAQLARGAGCLVAVAA